MGKNKSKKPTVKGPLENDSGKQENTNSQSGIWRDERFQHLVTDPRFKNLPKSQRKVKIDKRFQSMFTDKKFNVKYTVDKYGRRVNQSAAEDLKKYYELDSSASEDEDEDGKDEEVEEAHEQRKEEKAIVCDSDDSGESTTGETDVGENDELSGSDSEGDTNLTVRERLLDPENDYARGEARLLTDSSSGEETTDDEEDDPELQIDHVWGELANDAETTDESTRRLAVCNMDWDRIRATDLMVLFCSFLPPGGSVLSVKIYPSEFGKERMALDEKQGPIELTERRPNTVAKAKKKKSKKNSSSESDDDIIQQQDSDAEEGDEYHMEKLRQYQLNRLRYYYAVVECDSIPTADKIYQECDGIEYESSATKIDLRFIPDDTKFDDDEPRDVCTELPDSNSYKPREFTTTALQQSKVDLTWDETAVERQEFCDKLLAGKLDEVSDADLRKIVAYSSEEDEEEEENADEVQVENTLQSTDAEQKGDKPNRKKDDAIAKYKALLAEINEQEEREKNQKYEMQITWNVGEEKSNEDSGEEVLGPNIAQQQMTPIEKALQKRSEKNKKRKEERKKKKNKAMGRDTDESVTDDDSIPDDVDLNDPYFAAEFANGDFAAPKNKRTKKNKKKKISEENDETETKNEQELKLLLDDDDFEEDSKEHFSLEKILKAEVETKSKKKRKKQLKKSKSEIAEQRAEIQDNFEINVNDERFKAVYTSHNFNIDPSDSHFKKTKGMEKIIDEKLKRRHDQNGNSKLADSFADNFGAKRPKKQLENTLLVKSLKRKIQMKQHS